jgi:hypothetical protein
LASPDKSTNDHYLCDRPQPICLHGGPVPAQFVGTEDAIGLAGIASDRVTFGDSQRGQLTEIFAVASASFSNVTWQAVHS